MPWGADLEDVEDLLGHALLDEEEGDAVKVRDVVNRNDALLNILMNACFE